MAWELAAGSKESGLSALFRGASLLKRSGEAVSILSGLKDRTVLLYFASTEAEPCRHFTPLLYKFYELARQTDDSIAVVFVSDDKTKEEQLALFRSEEMHSDWLMVELLGVEDIMDAFDVKKIPSLVVLDREGKSVVKKARDEVWDLLQADREKGDVALKAAVAEKWAEWRRAAGDWRASEGHTLGGGGSSSSSAPFAAGSASSSSAAPFGAGGAGAAGCPGAVPAAGTRSDREALRAARLAALERRGLAGASGGGSASSSGGFGEAGASSSSSSTAAGAGPSASAPAAAASASSSSSSSALAPPPPAASAAAAGGAGPPRIATLGGGGASSSSSGAAGASSSGGSGTFASGADGAALGGAAYTLAGGRIELPQAPPLAGLLPPGIAEEDEDVVSDMASDGERSFRDESDLPEPDLGEAAAQIAAMGFPLDSAHRALQASNGDVDQAVAMLIGE